MLALHAIWARDRRLHLWAEDAAAFEAHRRRTARRASRVPANPWAAPAAGVAHSIVAATAGDAAWSAETPDRLGVSPLGAAGLIRTADRGTGPGDMEPP